jgi:prophage regulatory protein
MAAGTFPTAINIGPKSIAWLNSEVVDWIQERIGSHRKSSQSKGAVSHAE